MQLWRYIKQGIPNDKRGQVWSKMIGSQAIKAISSFNYQVIILWLFCHVNFLICLASPGVEKEDKTSLILNTFNAHLHYACKPLNSQLAE